MAPVMHFKCRRGHDFHATPADIAYDYPPVKPLADWVHYKARYQAGDW